MDLLQVRGAALFTASNHPLIPSFGSASWRSQTRLSLLKKMRLIFIEIRCTHGHHQVLRALFQKAAGAHWKDPSIWTGEGDQVCWAASMRTLQRLSLPSLPSSVLYGPGDISIRGYLFSAADTLCGCKNHYAVKQQEAINPWATSWRIEVDLYKKTIGNRPQSDRIKSIVGRHKKKEAILPSRVNGICQQMRGSSRKSANLLILLVWPLFCCCWLSAHESN